MNSNLSEKHIAKIVSVKVKACGVHWDQGRQGGVTAGAGYNHGQNDHENQNQNDHYCNDWVHAPTVDHIVLPSWVVVTCATLGALWHKVFRVGWTHVAQWWEIMVLPSQHDPWSWNGRRGQYELWFCVYGIAENENVLTWHHKTIRCSIIFEDEICILYLHATIAGKEITALAQGKTVRLQYLSAINFCDDRQHKLEGLQYLRN